MPRQVAISSRGKLEQAALWLAEAARLERTIDLQLVTKGHLRVLDRTCNIEDISWEEYHRPPLWAYHLHYFDDALPLALAARRGDRRAYEALKRWVLGWIRRCRPGRGPGWEPYPVSQRLANWAQLDLLLSQGGGDPEFLELLRTSAVQQANYLAANIEYHLLANHLLKNAKALYLAALAWPAAREATSWLTRARSILREQIPEQILRDGGHFERSPMYHAVILQDLVEMNVFSRAAGEPEVAPIQMLRSMADFHASMQQPDGTRARFNDTAEGLVADAARVEALYSAFDADWTPPQGRLVEFPDSGYYGYCDVDRGEAFLIDAGKPGPEYQPAHAHCDLLSFEFYTHGRPWIVNAGVHGYADDPYRAYARSTRAHNTLMLAGREQSEIWGTFRMARQARVVEVRSGFDGEGRWKCQASYTPYFDRRINHQRQVERRGFGEWLVTDRVSGISGAGLEGALHFHPSVQVDVDDGRLICQRDNERLVVEGVNLRPWRLSRGQLAPISGWFFPVFGVAKPCTTVRYELKGAEGRIWLRLV